VDHGSIGSHFVAAQHGDKTRSQVLRLALDRLLTPLCMR
jgi:hypothetical protein